MTDFATDLLWEDEKQPVLPVPGRPHERQQESRKKESAPVAPAESQSERLQRIAGNAALAREAEEAAASSRAAASAARKPEPVRPAPKPAPEREEAHPAETAKAAPARREAAKRRATADAVRSLSEERKQAVARTAALTQVLASFEQDAAKADLLRLALLLEKAPAGIAEETARALARAVMRADPAQRVAIAARLKTQLGDRRELCLARLLADRLAALFVAPARAAAPPPPPPAPA